MTHEYPPLDLYDSVTEARVNALGSFGFTQRLRKFLVTVCGLRQEEQVGMSQAFLLLLALWATVLAMPATVLVSCTKCGRLVIESIYRAQLKGRPSLTSCRCVGSGAALEDQRTSGLANLRTSVESADE